MRIAYYCQHVLGIGHFHRSLEICRALAKNHQTTLIVGGPDVDTVDDTIELFRLPGLQMNGEFQNLEPCSPGRTLEQVKRERAKSLFDFFRQVKPEVFITELYPFGRKAFRFELDPVLKAVKNGELSSCKCYSSVRDILVERLKDKEKFEERVVTTLNTLFDGVLIHSDQDVLLLDKTFSRMADVEIPTAYTGFVARPGTNERNSLRDTLKLGDYSKLIVASIGGGNVGGELLLKTVAAFTELCADERYHLQIFTGPYCDSGVIKELKRNLPVRTKIEIFADNFPAWLQAADLSVSMAGYNTCMNIVQAGVPALVYPFSQNWEQMYRAKQLGKRAPITVLSKDDLAADILKVAIVENIEKPRKETTIDLNGASQSAQQVELWREI